MEALRNALATLVALESRIHDLVDPVAQVAEAVKAVVKECAALAENFEARLAALEAHPALSVPALAEAVQESTSSPTSAPTSSSGVADAGGGVDAVQTGAEPPAP